MNTQNNKNNTTTSPPTSPTYPTYKPINVNQHSRNGSSSNGSKSQVTSSHLASSSSAHSTSPTSPPHSTQKPLSRSPSATSSIKENRNSIASVLTELHELKVYDASDPNKIQKSFKSILSSNEHDVVVVSFLRRFGCPVCRAVATGLSYLKEKVFNPMNIGLIAISIEDVGFKEFARKQYFSGKIYVDCDGSLFHTLRLKRLGVRNIFGMMELSKMKAAIALSSHEYFNDTRNFQGDYAQLGGLFVFGNYGNDVLFEFKEYYAGDTPLVHDILDAIQATSEIRNLYPNKQTKVLNIAQEAIREQKRFQLIRDKEKRESKTRANLTKKSSIAPRSPSCGDILPMKVISTSKATVSTTSSTATAVNTTSNTSSTTSKTWSTSSADTMSVKRRPSISSMYGHPKITLPSISHFTFNQGPSGKSKSADIIVKKNGYFDNHDVIDSDACSSNATTFNAFHDTRIDGDDNSDIESIDRVD